MTRIIDILFTPPHNAVELAALIFCWAIAAVAGYLALQLAILIAWGLAIIAWAMRWYWQS